MTQDNLKRCFLFGKTKDTEKKGLDLETVRKINSRLVEPCEEKHELKSWQMNAMLPLNNWN